MGTKYPPCEHIKRPIPEFEITNEITEAIGSDYRTLPIFEKGLHEFTYKKFYSLQNNEYLKCRWAEYKKHIEDRVFAPFQFLDIRDYHFYNCRNRLIPSQSIYNKDNFRMTLRPGPGVDSLGHLPIPQDLFMKRGIQKPKVKMARVENVKDEASTIKRTE